MDFDCVREYIVDSGICPKGHYKSDVNTEYDAIFLLQKPEKIEADTFMVYRFHQQSGGIVQKYRFEIDVCAKEILTGIDLRNKLRDLFDFKFRPCPIDNFVKFEMVDEDGFSYDENTGFNITTLYFDCNYF